MLGIGHNICIIYYVTIHLPVIAFGSPTLAKRVYRQRQDNSQV